MSVELLSPAGNIECFDAAIRAGANAIYAGIDRFSARAYAGNLTTEEYVSAIRRAHLAGVRVYLTLNTLLAQSEINDAVLAVRPLYESGLDGIIIQDVGLIEPLKDLYPELSLHASTQMAVMNREGVEYFSTLGFDRIVPARELTLKELADIRRNIDVELECFIHGAMCYSYSGMCLMSSMIGGRSGNRGRCAGTCRLPYRVRSFSDVRGIPGTEQYPLSMKDLCTVKLIPQLIEAGIDSFKIEGRMKSPEYVAGVTRMYRELIDRYYDDPTGRLSDDVTDTSGSLYVRTEVSGGYYTGETGAGLITMTSPGYNGSDDQKKQEIRDRILSDDMSIPVDMDIRLVTGQPSCVTAVSNDISVTAFGDVVEAAKKAPVSADEIRRRMSRLGNTCFTPGRINVECDGDIFIGVGALNELRRSVIRQLEDKIILGYDLSVQRMVPEPIRASVDDLSKTDSDIDIDRQPVFDVSVCTRDQLESVVRYSGSISRVIIDYALLPESQTDACKTLADRGCEIYVSYPCVFREKYRDLFDDISKTIEDSDYIKGVAVHGYDELAYISHRLPGLPVITDTSLYAANASSFKHLGSQPNVTCVMLSHESSIRDMQDILSMSHKAEADYESGLVVYGYIPVMFSAGCIKKTYGRCDNMRSFDSPVSLTDRMNKDFHVVTDCNICTNIIYNTVPLSLHNMTKELRSLRADRHIISLSLEDASESERVLEAYLSGHPERSAPISGSEFTTGHARRRAL